LETIETSPNFIRVWFDSEALECFMDPKLVWFHLGGKPVLWLLLITKKENTAAG
jgi:hypothetical protein